MKRLSRERELPTASAEVYEWSIDLDNPTSLKRTHVLKQLRSETLEMYTPNQKRYFSSLNKWHCCEDLAYGESPSDNAADEEWDEYLHGDKVDTERPVCEEPPPLQELSYAHDSSMDKKLIPDDETRLETSYDPDEDITNKLLGDLRWYRGFVNPIPFPEGKGNGVAQSLPEKDLAIFMHVLGRAMGREGVDAFLHSNISRVVHLVYVALGGAAKSVPSDVAVLYNLHPDCPDGIRSNPYVRHLCSEADSAGARYWTLDIGDGFHLGVKTPEMALAMCSTLHCPTFLTGLQWSPVSPLGTQWTLAGVYPKPSQV
ncbi:hypothetical protein NMY22_g9648 [Coprinellus aureogranulatus]|nr:hypothetical protein NMY22_g9648 [Coprinellus aureogranulatus]